MTRRSARGSLAGGVVAALLLLAAAPAPGLALHVLRAPAAAADPAAPLVALLSLLAWLLTGWLLLAVAVTAGGRLPGPAGHALSRVARRLSPPAVRRCVEVALGLTVAVAGSTLPAAAADSAEPAPQPAVLDLDWAAPPPSPSPSPEPSPSPPSRPSAAPPALIHAVLVQPGDSLWGLAGRDLARRGRPTTDAAVAQTWPAWWHANRDVIGDDPDLIHPGTPLHPPASS